MNVAIFSAGIACVVAGIVGGDINGFGLRIPAINSGRRQMAIILLGTLLCALCYWPKPVSTSTIPSQPSTIPSQSKPLDDSAQLPKSEAGKTASSLPQNPPPPIPESTQAPTLAKANWLEGSWKYQELPDGFIHDCFQLQFQSEIDLDVDNNSSMANYTIDYQILDAGVRAGIVCRYDNGGPKRCRALYELKLDPGSGSTTLHPRSVSFTGLLKSYQWDSQCDDYLRRKSFPNPIQGSFTSVSEAQIQTTDPIFGRVALIRSHW